MNEEKNSPCYFAIVEPRVWTENRFYRLYVLPEELVGVWAGRANEIVSMFGALGGFVGGLLAKKSGGREEELSAKSLEELRRDHKHNFAIRLEEIESAEIAPASFWFCLNYTSIKQVGLLHITCRDGKRLRFAIPSNKDMQAAIQLLTPQLGQKLRVGLAWDEGRKKYRSL
jgi:hypothetical protein